MCEGLATKTGGLKGYRGTTICMGQRLQGWGIVRVRGTGTLRVQVQ